MKYHCPKCGRYIMEIEGTTIVKDLIGSTSKCKSRLKVKVVTPQRSESDINFKFRNGDEH